MNRVLKLLLVSLLIILAYRFTFSYRIIPFPNSGDLKYKDNGMEYFPHFAFINPLKKEKLKLLIKDYCISPDYKQEENYLTHENYYIKLKETILENNFVIASMITDEKTGNYLILVENKKYPEANNVFILSRTTDKIIGYF
jgi:hypothetical protein